MQLSSRRGNGLASMTTRSHGRAGHRTRKGSSMTSYMLKPGHTGNVSGATGGVGGSVGGSGFVTRAAAAMFGGTSSEAGIGGGKGCTYVQSCLEYMAPLAHIPVENVAGASVPHRPSPLHHSPGGRLEWQGGSSQNLKSSSKTPQVTRLRQ